MTREEAVLIANAVRQHVRESLRRLPVHSMTITGRDLPAPQVHNVVETPDVHVTNQVPPVPVVVHVDMSPVATAIDRMTAVLERQAEMHAQLLQVLAEQPALVFSPAFSPTIDVPETQINVEAPNVTVASPSREKRSFVITHEDGTRSTVTEK